MCTSVVVWVDSKSEPLTTCESFMTALKVDASRAILELWANEKRPASIRLNARAWAILQNLQRRGGRELGEALMGSAQVATWWKSFNTMGLVGLMDAPRTGRPRSNESGNDARWREQRRTGSKALRVRRFALPIQTKEALLELAAIFVRRDLLVVAFDGDRLTDFGDLGGEWLDVPGSENGRKHVPTGGTTGSYGASDVINAIRVAASLTTRIKARAQLEQQQRFVDRLAEMASERPGKLAVAISAQPTSEQFRQLLSDFRRHRLWDTDGEGLLAALAFSIPDSCAHLTEFLSQFMRSQSATSPRPYISQLADALTEFRQGVFEWHRRSDKYMAMLRLARTSSAATR